MLINTCTWTFVYIKLPNVHVGWHLPRHKYVYITYTCLATLWMFKCGKRGKIHEQCTSVCVQFYNVHVHRGDICHVVKITLHVFLKYRFGELLCFILNNCIRRWKVHCIIIHFMILTHVSLWRKLHIFVLRFSL